MAANVGEVLSMATVRSLSESDVTAVREELAAGKPTTVWFTPAAVGVPVGGSARVVSVGEVTEGEFIEVKPAGSRDTMFCSPNELTRTRTPRKRAPRPEAAEPVVPAEPVVAPEPVAAATPVAAAEPVVAPEPVVGVEPVVPAKRGRARPSAKPVEGGGPATEVGEPLTPAARRTGQRKPLSAEIAITLVASIEGEWTVEVTAGKKRVVRPAPVQPAEVAKAARSLPAPVTEAIEASLAIARQRQAERVEQLRSELEAAQRALRDLNG